MATLDELSRALVNADAAGDTAGARVLAAEITKMRGTGPAAAPDPYREAAIAERDALKEKGVDTGAGITRRLMQGATFNAADEILAGLTTPLEMVKRRVGPSEGYKYAKARENLILEDARKDTGALGTVAEIGGGIGSGVGLMNAGLTTARSLAPNSGLLARTLSSGADAAGMGAVAGAMEGDGLGERAGNAAQGAAIGGLVGGAVPPALAVGSGVLSPVVSNIRARINPEGFARSQVARGVSESGMTPQQIAQSVREAAADNQPMFTMADAMGNAGQRMLASTARAPGTARTDVVNFLDTRQAGQGRRIANSLSEGFDAPTSANQLRTNLTALRSADADAAYGAARQQAGAVDVTPAITEIDRTLQPGVTRLMNPGSGIADDSVEGALRRARGFLTDGRSQVSRFEEAFRVKSELDNMIDRATPTQQRVLIPVRNALDRQLERASQPYAAARNQFREQSRAIDAIDEGRTAAMRGRTEDTIPAYRGLTPEGQTSYRTGYVDPLIEQTQGAAYGANKARPLTSDAFGEEAAAIAPGNEQMMRRLGRENTMFQTRNAATGNSKTAENLADDAALGFDPTIIGQVLSGNWSGALKSVIASGSNAITGNTPAVRQEIANILLTRGNANSGNIQQMIDETIRRIQQMQLAARTVGRGASGGLAVAPQASGSRR